MRIERNLPRICAAERARHVSHSSAKRKHSVLLSVGERAEFRLQKDKMLLRGESLDSKERAYVVVSMTPRSETNTADATPFHVNHLQ